MRQILWLEVLKAKLNNEILTICFNKMQDLKVEVSSFNSLNKSMHRFTDPLRMTMSNIKCNYFWGNDRLGKWSL